MFGKTTHNSVLNIVTLGSGVIEDAICNNEAYRIVESKRGVSLFSLRNDYAFCERIESIDKIDYFCIDFLYSLINVNENEDNPLDWSEQKLYDEIELLVDVIEKKISRNETKVVLLDARYPYQRVIEHSIVDNSDSNYIGRVNVFLSRCIELIKLKQHDVEIIPDVKIYCGSSDWNIDYPSLYITEYLEFIESFFDSLTKNEHINACLLNYTEKIDRLLELSVFPEIEKKICEIGETKRVVVLGSEYLMNLLKGIKAPIYKCIRYSRSSALPYSELRRIKNQDPSLVMIIPRLYTDELLNVLFGKGFTYPEDIFIPDRRIVLEDFIGIYTDVFNNIVETEKKITVCIQGHASRVRVMESEAQMYSVAAAIESQASLSIGREVRSNGVMVTLEAASQLFIGDNTTFADRDAITMGQASKCIIEKDCMFSTNVIISIDSDESKISPTFMEDNKESIGEELKRNVHLGEHVWIGYDVIILSGSYVGSSSVIGARSMTNTSYPNNCIIVGAPARIIKKDISWARNPFYTNMHQDESIETFLNSTKMV